MQHVFINPYTCLDKEVFLLSVFSFFYRYFIYIWIPIKVGKSAKNKILNCGFSRKLRDIKRKFSTNHYLNKSKNLIHIPCWTQNFATGCVINQLKNACLSAKIYAKVTTLFPPKYKQISSSSKGTRTTKTDFSKSNFSPVSSMNVLHIKFMSI